MLVLGYNFIKSQSIKCGLSEVVMGNEFQKLINQAKSHWLSEGKMPGQVYQIK